MGGKGAGLLMPKIESRSSGSIFKVVSNWAGP